jgi:WD40 repeat protein
MSDEGMKDTIPSGFTLRNLPYGNGEIIHRVAWSPDGTLLAIAFREKIVQVWDKDIKEFKNILEGNINYSIAWSPDGQTLAVGGRYLLNLWDTRTGQLRSTLDASRIQHLSIAWSPNGKLLA